MLSMYQSQVDKKRKFFLLKGSPFEEFKYKFYVVTGGCNNVLLILRRRGKHSNMQYIIKSKLKESHDESDLFYQDFFDL